MAFLKVGENTSIPFNGNISGFRFVAKIQHTTANTAFSGRIMYPKKIAITAVLSRNGESDVTILQGDLGSLSISSMYGSRQALLAMNGTGEVFTAAGVGVKEVLYATLPIKFDDILNLNPGESINLSVNIGDCFDTSVVDTSVSGFYFDPIIGTGIGTSTPILVVQGVNNNQITSTISGDNVTRAVFVNQPSTAVSGLVPVASRIVQTHSLSSKQYTSTSNSVTAAAPDLENYEASFNLYNTRFFYNQPSIPLSNFQLDLNYDNTLVVSGENTIVLGRRLYSTAAIQKAKDLQKKIFG